MKSNIHSDLQRLPQLLSLLAMKHEVVSHPPSRVQVYFSQLLLHYNIFHNMFLSSLEFKEI